MWTSSLIPKGMLVAAGRRKGRDQSGEMDTEEEEEDALKMTREVGEGGFSGAASTTLPLALLPCTVLSL